MHSFLSSCFSPSILSAPQALSLPQPSELLHSCAPSAWNDERCVADDLIKVEHLHAYRLQSSGQSVGPVHRGWSPGMGSQDARWSDAMFRDMTFFVVPFAKITLLRFLQLALGRASGSVSLLQTNGPKKERRRSGEKGTNLTWQAGCPS